jgi:hypothetical protein
MNRISYTKFVSNDKTKLLGVNEGKKNICKYM